MPPDREVPDMRGGHADPGEVPDMRGGHADPDDDAAYISEDDDDIGSDDNLSGGGDGDDPPDRPGVRDGAPVQLLPAHPPPHPVLSHDGFEELADAPPSVLAALFGKGVHAPESSVAGASSSGIGRDLGHGGAASGEGALSLGLGGDLGSSGGGAPALGSAAAAPEPAAHAGSKGKTKQTKLL